MRTDYMPTRESELVTYLTQLSANATALGAAIGLETSQTSQLAALVATWNSSYQTANDESTRNKATIIAKNQAKSAVLAYARELVGIIQKYPETTDEQRALLKINIPSPRTPVPVPDQRPSVDIISVVDRTVTIRVHDKESESKRAKPKGCASAAIFTYIGTTPPSDPSGYKFQGFTTRTVIPIQFDDSVPSGSLVWVSAAWLNPRGQFGIASAPRSFTLQGGPAVAAA